MIPAHVPPNDIRELISAIDTTYKSDDTKKIFEDTVKGFLGTDRYMTVGSGRMALYRVLRALHLQKNDEVIIPAFTTNIVPLIVKEVGATPVLTDVAIDDHNICLESILDRINKNTKAIMCAHFFGYPSDVKMIKDVCEDHKLSFIEDAASAFGAEFNNKPIGTFGDYAIFSYGFGKSISLGGGGGITASDDDLFKNLNIKIKTNKTLGLNITAKIIGSSILSNPFLYHLVGSKVKDKMISGQYSHYSEELNSDEDLTKISYALGIQQVRSKCFENRRNIAIKYNHLISKYQNIHPPIEKKTVHAVYTRYFVRCDSEDIRNKIIKNMKNARIEPLTLDQGYPISYDYCKFTSKDDIPNSYALSKILVGIPVYKEIPENKLHEILDVD